MAPPNQGPKATPSYEANLGQPSVFTLANGMRVFAGPRDDAFYFDSGATFDFLNFRSPAPVLTGGADQGQGAAFPAAVDGFAGYNISLIAVEMPISMATADGSVPTDPASPTAKIGGWATTMRQQVTVRPSPQRSAVFWRLRASGPRRESTDRGSADSAAYEGLLEPQPACQ